MALDHRRLIRPGKKIRPNFLRSTSLLYKILPTSLGTCNPTFYTSHLRWNSTMRRCFYHTDLGQNAVFHNFPIQINCTHSIHQDDRSTRGLLAKPLKKFPKLPINIRPAGSHICSASCGRVFEWKLLELRFNIIKNLLCFFLLFNGFIDMWSSKAFDMHGILSTPASDVHKRLKLNKQYSD